MATTPHGRQLLREWLDRSLLAQKDLAGTLGISAPYLTQILNGDRRPKLETLVRIERVTGVPIESWVETLVSDSDQPEGDPVNGPVLPQAK